MGHDIKTIKKKFKEQGIFYTDSKLAEYMKTFIPENVTEVYDPTCGNGSLLSVFADNVRKYGQELDEDQLYEARMRLTNFFGQAGDTLKAPAFMNHKFQAIVANPPFSIRWEPPTERDIRFSNAPTLPTASKADYAFMLHILFMLAEDGTAAVLNFPGVLYRGNREKQLRAWMIENNWIDKVVHIEGGYFEDTNICTAIIVFRKNRTEETVEFIDHETGQKKTVTIDEIRGNDYNLSVSSYIERETEIEETDPIELMNQIHRLFFENLRLKLQIERITSDMHGYNMEPLLISIEKLARTMRNELKKDKDERLPAERQLKMFEA